PLKVYNSSGNDGYFGSAADHIISDAITQRDSEHYCPIHCPFCDFETPNVDD
ncbi:hypothetical protein RR48_09632, partial [Papilio machaon]